MHNRAHDPEIRHNLLIYNDYFNHYMPSEGRRQKPRIPSLPQKGNRDLSNIDDFNNNKADLQ